MKCNINRKKTLKTCVLLNNINTHVTKRQVKKQNTPKALCASPPLQHFPFSQKWKWKSLSHVPDSLRPHGLYSPQNSPGQNIEVGSCSLLQGMFPTQGSNPGLPHCRGILYQLSYWGSTLSSKDNYFPNFLKIVLLSLKQYNKKKKKPI